MLQLLQLLQLFFEGYGESFHAPDGAIAVSAWLKAIEMLVKFILPETMLHYKAALIVCEYQQKRVSSSIRHQVQHLSHR